MRLTRTTYIKNTDPNYKDILDICHLSKNLYNAALYTLRQRFFETKKYISYAKVDQIFKSIDNPDYRALPSQTAQQTLRMVDSAYKSFFNSIKKGLRARIPGYLDKNGYYIAVFTNQQLSHKLLKEGIIKLPKSNITLHTDIKDNIKQVRFVPRDKYIRMEVVYDIKEPIVRPDNGRYISIDLGINNLATVASNVLRPIIINGQPIKSENQYYNKQKSKLQAHLPKGIHISNRIRRLTAKRNNVIKDYMHKASSYIVNQIADSSSICTIAIGYNKGWKQDTNMGKANNQKFTSIPYLQFVSMIEYKAKLKGIRTVRVNESYTSKSSFFDNDTLPSGKADKDHIFSGKRVSRGLYHTKSGWYINADVNGALNIMRRALKVTSDDLPAGRGFVSNPVRINILKDVGIGQRKIQIFFTT